MFSRERKETPWLGSMNDIADLIVFKQSWTNLEEE